MGDALTRADWLRVLVSALELKLKTGGDPLQCVIESLVNDYSNMAAREWLINQVNAASPQELELWMSAQQQIQERTSPSTTKNSKP